MKLLRRMVPSPLVPAVKQVRSLFRTLVPATHPSPLPADFCRAAIRIVRSSPPIESGRRWSIPLAITNHTPAAISPMGICPVGVLVEWRSYSGQSCGVPSAFAPLPRPLWPGEESAHAFEFPSPQSLGDYVAEFSLVQHGGPRFDRVGPRAKLDLAVTHPFDGGFNYHDIYSQADLSRDFWTASGPPSQAEFERLVPIKIQLLKDLGLTPDSRLLDIGCGTGLLATAAERYLSDRGLYYGTDLASEAIDFCKGRYRRPNFHFCVNEMTAVPIDGTQFDMVAFFSVFTHTYPDETALLLAEARRLLAPGGVIFADAFTSPLVAREAGSRYAVECNREHFLKLAALTGLKAEAVMGSAWNGQARREFFKFTCQS
jgi:ubiquinone/menaquinone biosynthesis C-methylase UbiE